MLCCLHLSIYLSIHLPIHPSIHQSRILLKWLNRQLKWFLSILFSFSFCLSCMTCCMKKNMLVKQLFIGSLCKTWNWFQDRFKVQGSFIRHILVYQKWWWKSKSFGQKSISAVAWVRLCHVIKAAGARLSDKRRGERESAKNNRDSITHSLMDEQRGAVEAGTGRERERRE